MVFLGRKFACGEQLSESVDEHLVWPAIYIRITRPMLFYWQMCCLFVDIHLHYLAVFFHQQNLLFFFLVLTFFSFFGFIGSHKNDKKFSQHYLNILIFHELFNFFCSLSIYSCIHQSFLNLYQDCNKIISWYETKSALKAKGKKDSVYKKKKKKSVNECRKTLVEKWLFIIWLWV